MEEYEQNQQRMAEERQKAISQQGTVGIIQSQKNEEELRSVRSKLDDKQRKTKELKEEKEQLEEELDSMKKKYKR
jgi:cell shape-determining protein MreC